MASCDLGPCTDGLDKTAPLKRSDATKEPLAKELPTPSEAYCGAARLHLVLIAGDAERRTRAERVARGVPIDDVTWREITVAARGINVLVETPRPKSG
jgi:LDH2 family malate/lactate/ureidoglycolate dehydrogenase